jgi:TP901 family phage tail tape measure protein
MSTQIDSKDLVQDGILKPLRDEMDFTIAKSKELSDSFLRVVKTQAEMANATKQNAAGYKQLVELEKKSKDALTEKEKMDQRILTLQKQSVQITKLQRQRQAELSVEMQRRNKIAKEEARQTNQNLTAYEKLQVRIAKLTGEYRNLLVAEGKETAQTKKMRDEILKLNAVRDRANESLGMHQNKVGQYGRALNGLNRILGQLGLAFGVFQVLRDTFGIISQSEDAFASLSAITGLTGEKFDVFKDAVMDTADRLKVSGTEVAEAAEKIASAQPALLENADALASVTEQAIILNKAIKGDLTETSMALVGVMNQFGLEADEAARVINILAAGSQAGAATVNQINESMVKFGTTAKLMNISVEESVGLIETLGEKAIFGADAGTALRNILLKMGSIDVLPQKALKQLEKYGVDTSIVKDTTLSLEERLQELSKVAKDSTAIMQIFGTENATAATVLLNSLGTYEKMTDAVTGTNVAQEQAAINSDTLTAVIGELRAAWENLVIKWSEGTDVAGGLKAVLRFVAENLETIIKAVFAGIKAWIAYKSVLTLTNNAGTGMIQMFSNLRKGVDGAKFSLGTFAKGLMGIVGIVAVLLPMFIDLVKATWDMYAGTSALDDAVGEYNERIAEERAKMSLLRVEVLAAIGDKEKMEELINRINATYGTTLKNIDDETMMMNQLWEAYQKVNAEMEKRIMQQVLEDKLLELFKARTEIESMTGGSTLFGGGGKDQFLSDVNKQISEIQAKLFKLNNSGNIGKMGGTPTTPDTEITATTVTGSGSAKKQEDALAKLRRENAEELIALENQLLQAGLDKELVDQRIFEERLLQYNEEFEMIERLNYGEAEYNKTLNERLKLTKATVTFLKKANIETLENNNKIKDSEKDKFDYMAEVYQKYADEQAKKQNELIKGIQDSVKQALDAISDMLKANEALLDIQIEKQQTILDASISKETELRDIARERGLDASESIAAEREIQKRARREIEALEQKKRNLEMMIAAMKLLADGSSVGDIKSKLQDIKGFVEGSFYEGTPYTIADALGHTGTRDGHIVRVDDNEAVLTGAQTRALGIGKGGNSTQDIVDMFKNLGQPAVMKMRPTVQNNGALERKLDRLIEATVSIPEKMPVNDTAFDTMGGYMHWTKKQKLRTERVKYSAK